AFVLTLGHMPGERRLDDPYSYYLLFGFGTQGRKQLGNNPRKNVSFDQLTTTREALKNLGFEANEQPNKRDIVTWVGCLNELRSAVTDDQSDEEKLPLSREVEAVIDLHATRGRAAIVGESEIRNILAKQTAKEARSRAWRALKYDDASKWLRPALSV